MTKRKYDGAVLARAEVDYFGSCPKCFLDGRQYISTYYNVGRAHWCFCDEHRLKWFIGVNLFSSWVYETEADWVRHYTYLLGCREVQSVNALLARVRDYRFESNKSDDSECPF